jgi:long-chain acyl-CoA synthetase
MLKTKPGIGMAVLIGDKRKFISALISPDIEALTEMAKDLGASTTDPAGLVIDPKVVEYIQKQVQAVNEGLSRYEQIKTFRILPAELSQETGELTPTMKVKRRVVGDKYGDLIDSMYNGTGDPKAAVKAKATA